MRWVAITVTLSKIQLRCSFVQTNRIVESLLGTTAPATVIVIRLLTGTIFLSEGIQKFFYPAELGVGRFEKLGIIYPSITAPLVGTVEIACGILLLLGFNLLCTHAGH